ncbi:MAG: hypothetical protein KGM49_00040 [Sphingomonadales bacterium]|nr:hypothetical protein [Sphingomonadales bacterium]
MVRSPLDESETSAFAWARFRRMMRWWAVASALIAAVVMAWFWQDFGLISIHFYIAVALGIACTVMMTGALMSLVFLSSGSGHDEVVRDFEPEDDQPG